LLTQDNIIDGGGFTFTWNNVLKYITQSTSFQQYQSSDGSGGVGEVKIDPGAVTLSGTGYIDIITPGHATAGTGWVLAKDASGHVEYVEAGTGTISSIELLMPPAFTVSDPNPLITDGTFTVTVEGTEDQYINGLGELATLPVYTVENGLHVYGTEPGETPANPLLFHLGGLLVEDTVITTTNGATQYVLGVSGTVNQDTRRPFSASNLGQGGTAVFSDFGSDARPNPTVEIFGNTDTYAPLLELQLNGPLPNPGDPGIWENRNSLLSLLNTGTTSVGARMAIDYKFRNTSVSPNPDLVFWPAVKLIAEATNVTENAETSNFSIRMFDGGSQQDKMLLEGKGQLTLNEYGTGIFTDGTTNINNALTYNLAVDGTGQVWKKLATGGGSVTEVKTEGLITGGPITITGTITTSVVENRLVGRWDEAGTGRMQEITIGTGLALSNTGNLTATAGGGTVTSVGGEGLITTTVTNPFTVAGTVTTSVQQKRLVGRWDAGGTGIMQEITVGTGLTLSATGDLTADGGGGTYDSNQGIYKDTTPANDTFMLGAPSRALSVSDIPFTESRFVYTDLSGLTIEGQGADDVAGVVSIINTGSAGTALNIRQTTDGNGIKVTQTTGDDFQNGIVINADNTANSKGLSINDSIDNTNYTGLNVVAQSADTTPIFVQTNPIEVGAASVVQRFMLLQTGQFPQINNMGGSIDFKIQTSTIAYQDSNKIITRWTDSTNATRTSQFEIQGVNSGAPIATQLTVKGTGQLQLNNYTTATSFDPESGPSVGVLNVDNVGNVFVGDGGGGGTYTVNNGLTENPTDNFQLGGPLIADTSISGDGNTYSLTLDDMSVFGASSNFKIAFTVNDGTTTSGISLQPNIASIGCGVNGSGNSSIAEFTDTQSKVGYSTPTQVVQFGADASGLYVKTPDVAATTATAGQVLTLINATTGEAEWADGGGSSPLTTKGDLYTFGTADTRLPVGLNTQVLLADSSTPTGLRWGTNTTPPASGYYLAISDSTTQTNPTADTPRAVKFNTTDLANGFSLQTQTAVFTGTINNGGAGAGTILTVTGVTSGTLKVGMVLTGGSITAGTFISAFTSGTGGVGTYVVSVSQNRTSATYTGTMTSQIVVANTGIYNIQFSSQMDKTDAGVDYVNFWLRKNGVDVTASAGVISLQGNAPAYMMAAWNYLIQLIAGDIVELYWGSADTNMSIQSEVAQISPLAHPAIPSTILTITQQAGILAGTGITAINSLTGAAQTLTVGTTGTDFAIVDSGSDHKFNLPTASASNRGALSSADWTRFDGFKTQTIGATVDGSGGTITAGQKGYVRIPYACTITSWSILTGNAGTGATITFDIWRANNAIPTVANSLVGAGTKPFLTSNTAQITSAAPTGWTSVTLAANDILGFNVETGAAVFSLANLQLLVTKI
jgi:hypothetical protein